MIQNINNFESFSANDKSFNVTNLGGFTAVIYASYTQNNERITLNSDIFSLFFSKEIKIPSDATNLHLYALVSDGAGQWIPVYNNNFSNAQSVALKLYGTIFSPGATILADPNPTNSRVLVKNNSGYFSRYKLTYTFNNLVYTMDSQHFTSGISREIAIPHSATNISVLGEFFSGHNWVTLYNKTIPNGSNLDLTFTGTITDAKYEESITTPPSSGNGAESIHPVIIAAKKPHKSFADLNDTITFEINVSNNSSAIAKNVTLKETLPAGLAFVPQSFKVNGICHENIDLSSSMINLGDIQKHSSILVSYEARIISLPNSNKFMDAPIFMFHYLDQNNSMKPMSILGSVISLSTGDAPTTPPHCCCCCPCQPTP